MKVGILAGGMGSRLAEETVVRPKPMVEVGGRPILWHIMMHYATYGFNEFVVALGYKGEHIKRYMADYCSLAPDLRVSLKTGRVERRGNGNGDHGPDDWVVDLIDTGQKTNTGGRIKRLAPHLGDGTFMLTWGDGVSNINLAELLKFHRNHGRIATVSAVRPPARFGRLELDGERVARFDEKPLAGEAWINGAFFVLEPRVFDYIEGDDTLFEREPLENLARDEQLMAYQHNGFWQCMDTMRDKVRLESLWATDDAPWKIWK
ncbi:MAG: glucose-1-phosphate cytidylyltransferase [Proteobacteria bacterium]|nr:glucose-1-phosphate cytidylyltransferase [Pseudomonadota bacterium]